MLGLFSNSHATLLISSFTLAFFGSLHCVGMCGGIAALNGRRLKDTVGYQVGRLIGYVTLGFFLGLVGSQVFSWVDGNLLLEPLFIFILMMAFLTQAFHWWKGTPERGVVRLSFLPQSLRHRLRAKFFNSSAFWMGLGTALLPCGWIASFGLIAASTASSWAGAGVFLMLALGSMPALLLVGFSANRLGGLPRSPYLRMGMATLVLVSGVYSLAHHYGHRSILQNHQEAQALDRSICNY